MKQCTVSQTICGYRTLIQMKFDAASGTRAKSVLVMQLSSQV
jgi:hypothetical protein